MSLKVQGQVAVSDTRELDVTGASGKYDDWHPNTNVATASGSYAINFNLPFHDLSLSAATTFSESSKSVGRSVTIHLNTGTSQYTPSWSGNVKWPGGTEPTWSDNQYWIINLIVGIGGTVVFGTAQGFEGVPSAASWPSGTFTARDGVVNKAGEVNSSAGDVVPVSSTASGRIYFWRKSGGGSYIQFRPIGYDSSNPNYWWTAGGVATAINSGVYQTFWSENTVSPDSTRVVVKTTLGAVITDSGYVSSSSVDTGAFGSASASITATSTGTVSDTDTEIVECWARASGYADTKVAEFRIECTATATGTACFTGQVPLYKWDTSTNECVITPMSQAYTEWQNRAEGETHHVIGQNNNIKEILHFKELEVSQLIYGINGADPFVTGGHPFLTTDGWKCCNLERGQQYYDGVELTQLELGDRLLKYDAEYDMYYEQEVLNITSSIMTKTVYLLDVAGDDTYVADGYIVHNK